MRGDAVDQHGGRSCAPQGEAARHKERDATAVVLALEQGQRGERACEWQVG